MRTNYRYNTLRKMLTVGGLMPAILWHTLSLSDATEKATARAFLFTKSCFSTVINNFMMNIVVCALLLFSILNCSSAQSKDDELESA